MWVHWDTLGGARGRHLCGSDMHGDLDWDQGEAMQPGQGVGVGGVVGRGFYTQRSTSAISRR